MTQQNFTASIELDTSPMVVFKTITDDVSKWWGGPDLHGESRKLNDEFIIHHPDAHFSKQKVIELIPGKKVVWLVTESRLGWLEKDKAEWTGTKMIFEISAKEDKTILHFTHEGLVPGKGSYERCSQGWNMVIKERLFNYITTGKSFYI